MKALMTSTSKKALTLVIMFFAPFLLTTQANAHYARLASWSDVPTAICNTASTNEPVPPYVCCQLLIKRHHVWHHVWKNEWVSGSCKNADLRATRSMGCKFNSYVYGTNEPIVQNCQYSYSTGRYR